MRPHHLERLIHYGQWHASREVPKLVNAVHIPIVIKWAIALFPGARDDNSVRRNNLRRGHRCMRVFCGGVADGAQMSVSFQNNDPFNCRKYFCTSLLPAKTTLIHSFVLSTWM